MRKHILNFRPFSLIKLTAFCAVIFAGAVNQVWACTRITYEGLNGNVFTGRTFDYDRAFNHELWVLPAGIEWDGQAGGTAADPFAKGPNDITWTSKYGSVVITTAGGGALDGMNAEGLSMSFNLDSYAQYGGPRSKGNDISVFFVGHYVLGTFATVNEAIDGMKKLHVVAVPVKLANGIGYNGIMSLTDASGDTAVFQWEKGVLKIYHGRQYNVMTNEALSPASNFGDMQKIRQYYRDINSLGKNNLTVFLPGSYSSEDRIARAGYYLDKLPKESDPTLARMRTFVAIRAMAAAMPFTDGSGDDLRNDVTAWTSVADLKTGRYYIDVPELLSPYYVDLNKVDLKPGAPLKKLTIAVSADLTKRETVTPYSGDVANKLETSKPSPVWSLENYK